MPKKEVLSAPESTVDQVAQWSVGGHSMPLAEASNPHDPNIDYD